MDAHNPSAIPTAASRAPVHIGAVGMMVRDLDRVTGYYRDVLGLTVQGAHSASSDASAASSCWS
jgi:catechol 2,3-dioxygenase